LYQNPIFVQQAFSILQVGFFECDEDSSHHHHMSLSGIVIFIYGGGGNSSHPLNLAQWHFFGILYFVLAMICHQTEKSCLIFNRIGG
jgi:hypothetical protein